MLLTLQPNDFYFNIYFVHSENVIHLIISVTVCSQYSGIGNYAVRNVAAHPAIVQNTKCIATWYDLGIALTIVIKSRQYISDLPFPDNLYLYTVFIYLIFRNNAKTLCKNIFDGDIRRSIGS